MNYLKKYPLFFSILTALLLAFTVVFAWNIVLYTTLSAAEVDYKRAESQYKRVLNEEPTDESLEASVENIKEVDGKLDALVKDLSSNSSSIIKETPVKKAYELQNLLRSMVDDLRSSAKSKDILIDENACFGYSKYYVTSTPPPPEGAVDELWKQFSVLKYILEQLYASKVDGVQMSLDLVQREALESETPPEEIEEDDKKTSRFQTRKRPVKRGGERTQDVFTIDKTVSAKVEGSIDTYAYKLTFRTKTDVLRNFLNKLKGFDLMLVVRSVEVSLATPIENPEDIADTKGFNYEKVKVLTEEEKLLQEMNAANTPIVNDNLSKFTVIIEYVELSKDEPTKVDDSDEDN